MTRLTVLLIVCAAGIAGCPARIPVFGESGHRNGWSAQITFELTTPAGGQGHLSMGGGVSATLAYTFSLADRWFISPGAGAFFNTFGTDFIPEYGNKYEGTVKNFGLRLPVYAGPIFRLSDDFELTVASGPNINISFYAKEFAAPNYSADIADLEKLVNLMGKGFNRIDMQWGLLASLTYKTHYSIGISASAGLTDAAVISDGPCSLHIRRNNLAFTMSYKF